ncbi:N-(5'-phosphoribosyl)anthranilate isomerase [Oryzomicrobium terrae]|uniref:N-(5'-phosphoribosyl)anthranilate isomerase n=1 Tax=Oryzomicrobium terrae TaxID=1735038 RepID=A0A5C1E6G0_9RHOO|nr:phosphoribosylanthranilate isomerase [Oryzomicrobium terrae]QEL64512.1 N-(5'-phosphoribosyl)anthranilate isomerase [Oryzomicrobium terrae]
MTRSFSAVTPRIKICGLTREADVDAAVAAGADALGFVFYAKSPRAVTAARAAELVRRVPPFVTVVGLFVNPAPDEVEGVLDHVPLNLLQFHGDEGEADCRRYRRPYLKAARMKAGVDLLKYAADFPSARGLLLDTFVDGYGGSGQTFDWSLIPAPAERDFSIVLSGGLDAGNVAEAIRAIRPAAVDVSSGVELHVDGKAVKGIKDPQRIQEFIAAVRGA